ncbi:MAG: hypothetical protein QOF60_2830, partial [Actinomycetota bacterium]|nr:hypothetical protein [Actinomycetota bacterium]
GAHETNDLVLAVDQLPADRRWFVRLKGEEKQVTTIWLHLRERTLHFETQFMPAPEENREALFEYLLKLNNKLFGVRFAIGDEDAVYLVGQLPWSAVDEDELDRIVGSAYAYTEQYFRPAMRLGYAGKFRG